MRIGEARGSQTAAGGPGVLTGEAKRPPFWQLLCSMGNAESEPCMRVSVGGEGVCVYEGEQRLWGDSELLMETRLQRHFQSQIF